MFSSHLRNHAKTAGVIAAFGNLQVSGVRRRKPEARCVVIWNVTWSRGNEVIAGIGNAGSASVAPVSAGVAAPPYNLFYDSPQLADLIEPNKGVHLRQSLAQLSREPL